ncbi:MAG: CHASE2 domain-containing protein [Bdellovibrionales bacterium]|nr:CHASE2 domain-containing protein [Bdellovibrionales bacterium]
MAVPFLENWLKNKWVLHALRIAFAAVITILLAPFKLDVLEYTTYDWRMQLTPRPPVSGNVVLLSIDRETLEKLKREPEALDWAVVLQKLALGNPAQVVSFINPSQIQGSYDDLQLLADVAGRLPFQYGDDDLPKPGLGKLAQLAPPFEKLTITPAPRTVDWTLLAKDGATRRLIYSYEGQPTLHPQLAERFNGLSQDWQYSGLFDVLESKQMLVRYRNKGSYPRIKFINALEGSINPADVAGKIVLIGRDTTEISKDYATTPLDKSLVSMSVLELHANILDTLILNQAPRISPDWVKILVTFLISLLAIYVVMSVRPGKGLVVLGTAVGIYLLAAMALFATMRWVVPVAHPLVAVFICYYFVIPYRLIIENRRSWEYYQKNRLLIQVEELKSNFMRMMSHDLKTPLARIQGMTDVIRQDSLSETQGRALNSISESTEELTDFIGSILSLSRIESKELKLQLRSRDVNQLVREAIRRTEYLAKKKDIEVVDELEPLFSIKVDEDLLKTVLINLLENAIKYSNNRTRIMVTTEEVDNDLVIQVSDQGRGIPKEELAHIFDRFYRARNSRSITAGNGLGLYLAKYFVELHNGRIDVESVLDKGSTFTVRLPMNLHKDTEQFEAQGGLYV